MKREKIRFLRNIRWKWNYVTVLTNWTKQQIPSSRVFSWDISTLSQIHPAQNPSLPISLIYTLILSSHLSLGFNMANASRVKPSTPAGRTVKYKRDRSPTRPTAIPRDPSTSLYKPKVIQNPHQYSKPRTKSTQTIRQLEEPPPPPPSYKLPAGQQQHLPPTPAYLSGNK
jgi:hypothetical protein